MYIPWRKCGVLVRHSGDGSSFEIDRKKRICIHIMKIFDYSSFKVWYWQFLNVIMVATNLCFQKDHIWHVLSSWLSARIGIKCSPGGKVMISCDWPEKSLQYEIEKYKADWIQAHTLLMIGWWRFHLVVVHLFMNEIPPILTEHMSSAFVCVLSNTEYGLTMALGCAVCNSFISCQCLNKCERKLGCSKCKRLLLLNGCTCTMYSL